MGVGEKGGERERGQLVWVDVTLGVPFLVGGTVLFQGCVEVGCRAGCWLMQLLASVLTSSIVTNLKLPTWCHWPELRRNGPNPLLGQVFSTQVPYSLLCTLTDLSSQLLWTSMDLTSNYGNSPRQAFFYSRLMWPDLWPGHKSIFYLRDIRRSHQLWASSLVPAASGEFSAPVSLLGCAHWIMGWECDLSPKDTSHYYFLRQRRVGLLALPFSSLMLLFSRHISQFDFSLDSLFIHSFIHLTLGWILSLVCQAQALSWDAPRIRSLYFQPADAGGLATTLRKTTH